MMQLTAQAPVVSAPRAAAPVVSMTGTALAWSTNLHEPTHAAPAVGTPAVGTPASDHAAEGDLTKQGARFVVVGSGGTALQLGLYAAAASLIGAQLASIASWLISTLVTNAAHRALTFGVRGAERNRSDQLVAFLTCVVGLLVTSMVLAEVPDADGISGVIAILAVNIVVGAARFLGLRWWLSASGQRVGSQIGSAIATLRDGVHLRGPLSRLPH